MPLKPIMLVSRANHTWGRRNARSSAAGLTS